MVSQGTLKATTSFRRRRLLFGLSELTGTADDHREDEKSKEIVTHSGSAYRDQAGGEAGGNGYGSVGIDAKSITRTRKKLASKILGTTSSHIS